MMYLQRILPILALAAFTSPVWAGGPAPYEIGTPDLGLASAGWSARAQDAATVATNPAGMTRLDRSDIPLIANYSKDALTEGLTDG